MRKTKAILWDLDGVLADATELHYKALNAALATHGTVIKRDEHISKFNGIPTKKKLEILVKEGRIDRSSVEEIERDKQRMTKIMVKDLTPDPEKVRLLKALRNKGIMNAVCSNSILESVIGMLAALKLFELIDLPMGNDIVVAYKPDPEIYVEAAKQLDVPMSSCIIVEDSPVGIKAAYAAKPGKVIEVRGVEEVNYSLLHKLTYI